MNQRPFNPIRTGTRLPKQSVLSGRPVFQCATCNKDLEGKAPDLSYIEGDEFTKFAHPVIWVFCSYGHSQDFMRKYFSSDVGAGGVARAYQQGYNSAYKNTIIKTLFMKQAKGKPPL